jgi:hypothetical protein
MEEVDELIRRYRLEEDLEHVIIPVDDQRGHTRRIFLLKRRFMRIMYPEGQFIDYPMTDAIEATVRYPELLLSEALYRMHRESDAPEGEEGLTSERTTEDAVYKTGSMTKGNEE